MPSFRNTAAGWSLIAAALWLCTGSRLLWLCAGEVATFFYQPRPIAVLHCFTLGWISALLTAALYVIVPALDPRHVARPRLAKLQVVLFHFGAAGLVAHFWIGRMNGMAWSAATILVGVLLLPILLGPSLWRTALRRPAALAFSTAIFCLFATAAVGTLLAIDKLEGFLPGNSLRNLSAHAHLGLFGWMGLGATAAWYKLLPPRDSFSIRATGGQIAAQTLAVLLLATGIALGSRWVLVAGAVLVGTYMWHMGYVWKGIRRDASVPGMTLGHLAVGYASLSFAFVCGALLSWRVSVGSEMGTRLTEFYGVLLLLGWMSNVSLAAIRRIERTRPSGRPLLQSGPFEFFLLNLALIDTLTGVLAGSATGLRLGAILLATLGAVLALRAVAGERSPVRTGDPH